MMWIAVRAHTPSKTGLGVELEILKLELLVRCDDACISYFVEACKCRNVEK
jgi:hypothetical protein